MDRSPRKRLTRAQVAAKAAAAAQSSSKAKTKAAISASKAGSSTATISTSTTLSSSSLSKRKTRTDEIQKNDGLQNDITCHEKTMPDTVKTTRARTRAAAVKPVSQRLPETEDQVEAEIPTSLPIKKPPRGRPKKTSQPDSIPSVPARILRGRTSKPGNLEEKKRDVVEEKLSKNRDRTVATIEMTHTASITKPTGPKRRVKFEELEKENIIPTTTKQKKNNSIRDEVTYGTGLRAKPLRKPASTTRVTRGRNKSLHEDVVQHSSCPLSPKKSIMTPNNDTEVLIREYSDDELAISVNRTSSVSPMKISPKKSKKIFVSANEKHDFPLSTIVIHTKSSNSETFDNIKDCNISSNCQPPEIPLELVKNTSDKDIDYSNSLLESSKPVRICTPALKPGGIKASPFPSLLQSPARRLPQPQEKIIPGNQTLFTVTPKIQAFLPDVTPKVVTTRESDNNGNLKSPGLYSRLANKKVRRKTSNQMKESNISNEMAGQMEIIHQSYKNLNKIAIPEPDLTFSGRMSCIVPRDIDPNFAADSVIYESKIIKADPQQETVRSTQIVENLVTLTKDLVDEHTPFKLPPIETRFDSFKPRKDIDLISEDSDSEDELSLTPVFDRSKKTFMSSPLKKNELITPNFKTDNQVRQNQDIGFTPLAQQFSRWMTSSPLNLSEDNVKFLDTKSNIWDQVSLKPKCDEKESDVTVSLTKNISDNNEKENYKEEIMTQLPPTKTELNTIHEEIEQFEVDKEDLELALEANEMSLLEPNEIKISGNVLFSPESSHLEKMNLGLSLGSLTEITKFIEEREPSRSEIQGIEHNQTNEKLNVLEENSRVIDPRLLVIPIQTENQSYMTPKRNFTQKIYHTVCKVPLKPAGSDIPEKSVYLRSASASRVPAKQNDLRYHTEQTQIISNEDKVIDQNRIVSRDYSHMKEIQNLMTPSKKKVDWSSLGTPARTPRLDLDKSLLKGAVIYVDVYTTDGADASVIFTELLTQMGARCVKSWSWSGNLEDGKIGITHVVYKDGGKRTLEKVRESDGVVTCVGVGWVLDCERENKWLNEKPYLVDTEVFPRGGNRRRKSMEPRAIANLNGTLIPCPNTTRSHRRCYNKDDTKEDTKVEEETPMTSRSHRRDSVEWHRKDLQENEKVETQIMTKDESFFHSPLPATPAGMKDMFTFDNIDNCIYDRTTPIDQEDDEDLPNFLKIDQLVQKTAPVKQRHFDAISEIEDCKKQQNSLGITDNISSVITGNIGDICHTNNTSISSLSSKCTKEMQEYGLMMRLLAARRKSLQWAPKIGSPLAQAFP